MELNQISNGTMVYGADGVFSLTAGQKIKFKAGGDDFKETVPDGKKWTVTVSMKVEEEYI